MENSRINENSKNDLKSKRTTNTENVKGSESALYAFRN